MPQQFNVGESVQKKSGGAVMTVEGYDDAKPTIVRCSWRINKNVFHEEHPEDNLRKLDPDGLKVTSF